MMTRITSGLQDDVINWLVRRFILLNNLQECIDKLSTGWTAYASPNRVCVSHQLGVACPTTFPPPNLVVIPTKLIKTLYLLCLVLVDNLILLQHELDEMTHVHRSPIAIIKRTIPNAAANSFSMTAMRFGILADLIESSILLRSVVFPAPRKPVRTVTGIRDMIKGKSPCVACFSLTRSSTTQSMHEPTPKNTPLLLHGVGDKDNLGLLGHAALRHPPYTHTHTHTRVKNKRILIVAGWLITCFSFSPPPNPLFFPLSLSH